MYKTGRIGDYDALIFGWYPYNTYRELEDKSMAEWIRGGRTGTQVSFLPIIFLASKDGKRIASFHWYPYNKLWDQILSTFKFIE